MDFATVIELVKIFYGVLDCLLFLFGSDLFIRYFKADKQTRSDPAYTLFFLIGIGVTGVGFYTIFAINDYVYQSKDWMLGIQNLIAMLLITILALTVERMIFQVKYALQMGKIKISYLTIGGICINVYIFILLLMDYIDTDNYWDVNYYYIVYVAMIVYGITGFVGFITILFYQLKPQTELRQKLRFAIACGVMCLAGSGIRSLGRWNHNEWMIIGMWIEITGWIIFRFLVLSIPSYSELEWRRGIIELHLILAESGILVYSRHFRVLNVGSLSGKNSSDSSSDSESSQRPPIELIGGGMIGVKNMLGEITGSNGKLQHIEIGEIHVCCSQGRHILALLLCEKNLGVYYNILKSVVNQVESDNPDLHTFNGSIESLKINPIIDEYFGKKLI